MNSQTFDPMSIYIAFLDANNEVTQIIKSPDDGQDWVSIYAERHGCTCIETAKDGSIRGKYADVGDTYYADVDAFIEPRPFPSWTLNKSEKRWDPPVPMPDDELFYRWDEDRGNWQIYWDPLWGDGHPK